jgi:hypothetical protein
MTGHGRKFAGSTRVAGCLTHLQLERRIIRSIATTVRQPRPRPATLRWYGPDTPANPFLPTIRLYSEQQPQPCKRLERDIGTTAFYALKVIPGKDGIDQEVI